MSKCSFVPIHKWPKIDLGLLSFVIANNPCLVKQGMQWTKHLPTNTLMLFPNMNPGVMFHTNNCVPLDIVPVSCKGKILDIWTVDGGQTGIGPAPQGTTHILESLAGWFYERNLRPGDTVSLYVRV